MQGIDSSAATAVRFRVSPQPQAWYNLDDSGGGGGGGGGGDGFRISGIDSADSVYSFGGGTPRSADDDYYILQQPPKRPRGSGSDTTIVSAKTSSGNNDDDNDAWLTLKPMRMQPYKGFPSPLSPLLLPPSPPTPPQMMPTGSPLGAVGALGTRPIMYTFGANNRPLKNAITSSPYVSRIDIDVNGNGSSGGGQQLSFFRKYRRGESRDQTWRNEVSIASILFWAPAPHVVKVYRVNAKGAPGYDASIGEFIDFEMLDGAEKADVRNPEVVSSVHTALENLHARDIVFIDMHSNNILRSFDGTAGGGGGVWTLFDFDLSGVMTHDHRRWQMKPPEWGWWGLVRNLCETQDSDEFDRVYAKLWKWRADIRWDDPRMLALCKSPLLTRYDKIMFFIIFGVRYDSLGTDVDAAASPSLVVAPPSDGDYETASSGLSGPFDDADFYTVSL